MCVCREGGGKTALNAWKKHEAATVSTEHKKNSREKCQQPIAASFFCCRRHGLCFAHVSFLTRYASSFHAIKHKYNSVSATQGASQSCSLWNNSTEIRETEPCVCTASWSSLHVCQFVSLSVTGSHSLLFCSVKHEHAAPQFISMIDDVCWIMARCRCKLCQDLVAKTATQPELPFPLVAMVTSR